MTHLPILEGPLATSHRIEDLASLTFNMVPKKTVNNREAMQDSTWTKDIHGIAYGPRIFL
jgi:hypothetical protein